MKPISIVDAFAAGGRAVVLGLAVSAVAACAPAAVAQTGSVRQSPALREAAPQKAGVSPERLARIDAICEQAVLQPSARARSAMSRSKCPAPGLNAPSRSNARRRITEGIPLAAKNPSTT